MVRIMYHTIHNMGGTLFYREIHPYLFYFSYIFLFALYSIHRSYTDTETKTKETIL